MFWENRVLGNYILEDGVLVSRILVNRVLGNCVLEDYVQAPNLGYRLSFSL
ncbi:hypothetical protein Xsto_00559 [Xenorhabdus stockiae]|uniref:Uncharacterized protein n=1 Tax=Xenorhabdus stockiae TaxID=351614 RepID=A0A2D0KVM6_9GAMM|nr:hypothetical protein Xekk_01526 [Xenorhabdus sp. KK7.4]PHM67277.1 hypothetical protein Xsto_00559 [Xenorhabdus stockiae]PHM69079.1 hypothetical protein Xekj_02809 [Xenorhabdus sp. KJ12.1]